MSILFAPKKLSDFRLTGHQYCCPDSLQDGTLPDGTPCVKYLLRPTDARVSSSIRAEAEYPAGVDVGEEDERWYGLTFFFEQYDKDPTPESIFQFHDNDGSTPPGSIQVNNGRLLYMRATKKEGNTPYDIGALELNKNVNIVIHVKWSVSAIGIIEVWKDGVKVVSKSNVVTNCSKGNYGKCGINKWSWDKDTLWSTIKTPRRYSIGNLKIGDAKSSYNEVAPGAVVVPPPVVLPNQAPIAVAGADQTIKLPLNDITLDGSGSTDKDGKIVSYKWSATNGITLGTSSSLQLNDLTEGKYYYTLTVTDDKGATGTDEISVTVLAADPLPAPKITSTITTVEIDFDNGAKEFWVNGVKQ